MDGQFDMFEFADERKLAIRIPEMSEVMSVVCEICEVNLFAMEKIKTGKIACHQDYKERMAKNIVAYILYKVYGIKLTAIANLFQLKDHSTVSYRIKQAELGIAKDAEFKSKFIQCMKRFAKVQTEPQNVFHDIATYMLINHHVGMPKSLIYEMTRIDQWLRASGYKLALKKLEKK